MTSDAPPRARLPYRRLQATEAVAWRGREWLLSVGFDRSGAVREAFVKGLKAGSEMDAIMDDACVLLSLLLQAGYSAQEVDRRLAPKAPRTLFPAPSAPGREGADSRAPAASPLGLLARTAAAAERDIGAGVRAFHGLSSPDPAPGSAAAPGSPSKEAPG